MKLCFEVSGNTYPHRTFLRERGYKWDPAKKVWVGEFDYSKERNDHEVKELRKLDLNVLWQDSEEYKFFNKESKPSPTSAPKELPATIGEWTHDQMRELLMKDDRAVAAALVAIYNKQTEDEKRASDTYISNGVGFRANHAKRGSYYAKWIISGRALSGDHVDKGRKIALFYVQQLIDLANKKRG